MFDVIAFSILFYFIFIKFLFETNCWVMGLCFIFNINKYKNFISVCSDTYLIFFII